MRTAVALLAVSFSALLSHAVLAQARTPTPPPKPPPQAQPPPPRPAAPPPPRSAAPTRATMTVMVTDRVGKVLSDVEVGVTGPVERDGSTDAEGNVAFRNMGAGTYRLRFEHPEFITLEREVTMQAGRTLKTTAALSPAPKPAKKEEPEEPVAPPPTTSALPPPGSQAPTSLSIPDVVENTFIGRGPSRTSAAGCAGVATATLIQLREPLAEHAHADADETLYVVAGEGIQRAAGIDVPLTAGILAMVPRGTPHTITRSGSRPLVLLSILSGPPCTAK